MDEKLLSKHWSVEEAQDVARQMSEQTGLDFTIKRSHKAGWEFRVQLPESPLLRDEGWRQMTAKAQAEHAQRVADMPLDEWLALQPKKKVRASKF